MAMQVLNVWRDVVSVEDLQRVLGEIIEMARFESADHHPSTLYLNRRSVTLVRETLSDGSSVLNVNLFDDAT